MIEPASKVFVPVRVIRTWVNAPDSVLVPAVIPFCSVASVPCIPVADHTFPVTFTIVMNPLNSCAAVTLAKPNPVVYVAEAIEPPPMRLPPPLYNVVANPPESPICTKKLSVPDNESPDHINVTLFAHGGIPVNSAAVVKSVTATLAVPTTNALFTLFTTNVPVPSGKVMVLFDAIDVGAISRT